MIWHAIKNYRPNRLEVIGIIGTAITMPLWLYWQGWRWQAWILAPTIFVASYLSGDMLYDLWVVRHNKD